MYSYSMSLSSRYCTHLAIWMKPQEAAACRGVQPSLSPLLTSLPLSTRNCTISAFSSMQACQNTHTHHAIKMWINYSIYWYTFNKKKSLSTLILDFFERQNCSHFQNLLNLPKAPGLKQWLLCLLAMTRLSGLLTAFKYFPKQWNEWNSESI